MHLIGISFIFNESPLLKQHDTGMLDEYVFQDNLVYKICDLASSVFISSWNNESIS